MLLVCCFLALSSSSSSLGTKYKFSSSLSFSALILLLFLSLTSLSISFTAVSASSSCLSFLPLGPVDPAVSSVSCAVVFLSPVVLCSFDVFLFAVRV